MPDVEVFLPRIRFKRPRREKSVWVTEALFPGYLFAWFNWETSLRRVQYTSGTRSIVHFGDFFPLIPEKIIEDLRQILGTAELHTIFEDLAPGDAVQISDGTLRGLSAVVSRVLPGRQRVAVLMELLGQQTTVELTATSLVKEGQERAVLFRNEKELN
jgi:transcriptional antiterminator RfaH